MEPFVLSLSKDCPLLFAKSGKQIFDKLRPNGWSDIQHHA
jgi:Fe-S cluster biosynthesis and repair protein YggX